MGSKDERNRRNGARFATLLPMSKTIASCAVSILFIAGTRELELSPQYKPGLILRVESRISMATETTSFEILRNGEAMDTESFGGGGDEEERTVVTLERVIESADGVPIKWRREFETVEGSRTSERRGEELYSCPLDGVTLELRSEEGEIEVEVVDGDEPEENDVLEGHQFGLSCDVLFPEESVDPGQSWELNSDDVARLLGLGLNRAMFQRSEVEGGGERSRGEGRRGPRGARGGGIVTLLRTVEWDATATLAEEEEERAGETCLRIDFVLEAEEEVSESDFGGRRERMFEMENRSPLDSTFEIEIKGFLLFSLESNLPVLMEIEGTIGSETNSLRERGDMTIEMNREQVSHFERSLAVSREEESN